MSRDLKRMRRKLLLEAARAMRREAQERGGTARPLSEWVQGAKLSIYEAYRDAAVQFSASQGAPEA